MAEIVENGKSYLLDSISKKVGLYPRIEDSFYYLFEIYMEENGLTLEKEKYRRMDYSLSLLVDSADSMDSVFIARLRDNYLVGMACLCDEGRYDEAVWMYFYSMINELCHYFDYQPKNEGKGRMLEN